MSSRADVTIKRRTLQVGTATRSFIEVTSAHAHGSYLRVYVAVTARAGVRGGMIQ